MQPVGPPILKGYDITKQEYIETNRTGGIIRLGLHVSCPACNLSCPYCLNGCGTHYVKNIQTDSVGIDDRKSWIRQAYELGARCFVIDGIYEPLANEAETLELLGYIRSLGVTPILITNMTYMDERIVKRLAEMQVSVLGKLNVPMVESDHPNYRTYSEVQAYLTGGNSGVYERLKSAIHLLMVYTAIKTGI